MKTLTRTEIACYMIVLMIVFVFMLQDTSGKIKLALVSEIYTKPLWQSIVCLT